MRGQVVEPNAPADDAFSMTIQTAQAQRLLAKLRGGGRTSSSPPAPPEKCQCITVAAPAPILCA
jgi:hypothetical protein